MDELMRQEVQNMIDASNTQNLSVNSQQTPFHTHNRIDSPQIKFPNIFNASAYQVLLQISLSPAQIKALFSTPQILVPAQGANTLIIVNSIAAQVIYKGTPYAGTHAMELRYKDASGDNVAADLSNAFLNSSANAYSFSLGLTGFKLATASINQPVIVDVSVANPTAGNSPITFIINYQVVYFN